MTHEVDATIAVEGAAVVCGSALVSLPSTAGIVTITAAFSPCLQDWCHELVHIQHLYGVATSSRLLRIQHLL